MSKTTLTFAALIVAICCTATAAEARHSRHHHHRSAISHKSTATFSAKASKCEFDNNGHTHCLGSAKLTISRPIENTGHIRRISRNYIAAESGVVFIPNPPGTWRVRASCAHRLAAYLHLGDGLDAVSTWPQRFHRVSGPGVGYVAVRHDQHHIMGITGGGPGAWAVADFNSGGHLNRAYTVANFGNYFFLDPHSSRMARR